MKAKKNLVGLEDMPVQDIRDILAKARQFEQSAEVGIRHIGGLEGMVVANLFFEDSTRTRASFRIAARRLGADVLDLTSSGSSVSKGETLIDTARNIEVMGVQALVVRHGQSGAVAQIAKSVNCAVLNAGDGAHEHPTQALLDAYTIANRTGRPDFDFTGLTVGIVGDIAHSRVARSNIHSLTKLGAEVILVGPTTLVPTGLAQIKGVSISHSIDDILPRLDVIEMLRVQFERMASPGFPSDREFSALYGLNSKRLAAAKENSVVMHPGPINRGIELDGDVADGPQSAILEQVKNGVYVRMACLHILCLESG